MTFEKSKGLIAAPFTPMAEDGSVDTSLIPAYYNLLKENGVTGAFICGSSGEGTSLTIEEKIAIVEKWAACTAGDTTFRVIMMVGGNCVPDCIRLAKKAESLGIYGIAVTSPFYYKPADEKALAAFCMKIGKAVPALPFYYYHIPVLTNVNLSMLRLMELLDNNLENFAGIKYTHEDLLDFLSCLTYKNQKYDMLWGRDESLLSGLVLGVKSAVGSTYNYAAPLYLEIIKAFENGQFDKAVDLQQRSIDMIKLLGKYGGIATGKSFMKLIGLDCGKFREPVNNMNEIEFEEFRKDTEKLNFSMYSSVVSSIIAT